MDKKNKLATRDAYGEVLVELGSKDEDIVVLDADLSGSTRTAFFAKAFPERFFNMGIAEQDMIGTAAGFACAGKKVFASSFAMFASGRPWEMIRNFRWQVAAVIYFFVVVYNVFVFLGGGGCFSMCVLVF